MNVRRSTTSQPCSSSTGRPPCAAAELDEQLAAWRNRTIGEITYLVHRARIRLPLKGADTANGAAGRRDAGDCGVGADLDAAFHQQAAAGLGIGFGRETDSETDLPVQLVGVLLSAPPYPRNVSA
jgi:hypothetical protein